MAGGHLNPRALNSYIHIYHAVGLFSLLGHCPTRAAFELAPFPQIHGKMGLTICLIEEGVYHTVKSPRKFKLMGRAAVYP